jgi:sugar/nucleoside kinase (ribokinase family)
MAPYLPTIDYLLPNQEEAALLTGESDPETAAARFLEAGLGTYAAGRHLPAGGPAGSGAVVIKLGADGCLICTRSRTIHGPGFLARTVDTTGAGDTFVAAFLSRILAGDDLADAGRFANRLAARYTEHMGATPKEIW